MSEINTEQSTTNLDGDKILVVVEPVMKTAVEALSVLGKTKRLTVIGKGESCPNAVAVSNILTQKMLKGNSKIEKIASMITADRISLDEQDQNKLKKYRDFAIQNYNLGNDEALELINEALLYLKLKEGVDIDPLTKGDHFGAGFS